MIKYLLFVLLGISVNSVYIFSVFPGLLNVNNFTFVRFCPRYKKKKKT